MGSEMCIRDSTWIVGCVGCRFGTRRRLTECGSSTGVDEGCPSTRAEGFLSPLPLDHRRGSKRAGGALDEEPRAGEPLDDDAPLLPPALVLLELDLVADAHGRLVCCALGCVLCVCIDCLAAFLTTGVEGQPDTPVQLRPNAVLTKSPLDHPPRLRER